MVIHLTREPREWRYRTEDGTLVSFENCTIGTYQGKTFMCVYSESEKDGHKVVTEEYLKEVIKEIKFYDQPRLFHNGTVRILEEVEVAEEKLNRAEVFYNMSRAAMFSIDGGKSFAGYTFNEHWSGWECPYFTKEVADEICKEYSFTYTFKKSDGMELHCRYYYDEKADAYFVQDDNEGCDAEKIGRSTEINTPDGRIKAYDFCYAGWRWDEDK